jgi:hypothetical protein
MKIKVFEITPGQADVLIFLNKEGSHHLVPCRHNDIIFIESKYLDYPYFSKHKKYLDPYNLVEKEIELESI